MNTQNDEQINFQRGQGFGTTTPSGRMQGEGMVDQVKGKVQELSGDVRDKVQDLSGEVRDKAGEQISSGLNRGKARTADTLRDVAQSLRQSSLQLGGESETDVSRYVERAANGMERVSNYLQRTDVAELVDGVEDFARREPMLFVGGAFALGLLGARFLKSTQRQAGSRSLGARDEYTGRYETPALYGGQTQVSVRAADDLPVREPGQFTSRE